MNTFDKNELLVNLVERLRLQEESAKKVRELKEKNITSLEELNEKIDNLQKDITTLRDMQKIKVEKNKKRDLEDVE